MPILLAPERRRALWLARAYYGLYFAGIGALNPYINLHFQKIGLDGLAIGLLAATGPLGVSVTGPLWGSLGDRFHIHRALLPLASLGPIVPVLLLSATRDFTALAGLMLAVAFFGSAIGPLIDSATLELVAGTGLTYGGIRLWGTLGFIAATTLVGVLIQSYGQVWSFWIYAGVMLGAALVASGLPARGAAQPLSLGVGLRQLLTRRPFAFFLLGGFLAGAAVNAAFTFYPLRLQSLGATTTLIGLAGAISALSELPALFYSKWMLRKLSAWGSAALGGLMYMVRWACVAWAGDPGAALATQLFHGLSFAPSLIGGVAYVEEHTPAGLSATAQALYTAAYFGVGGAVGLVGGGWLYDRLGPGGFYLTAAAANLLGLAFMLAARRAEPGKPRPSLK